MRLVHTALPGPTMDLHRDGWRHFLARLSHTTADDYPMTDVDGRADGGDPTAGPQPENPGGPD